MELRSHGRAAVFPTVRADERAADCSRKVSACFTHLFLLFPPLPCQIPMMAEARREEGEEEEGEEEERTDLQDGGQTTGSLTAEKS